MHKLHKTALLTLVAAVLSAGPLSAEKLVLQQGLNDYKGCDDTFTSAYDKSEPHGDRKGLSGASYGSNVLIRFDVSGIPEGSVVTSAKLSLFCEWMPKEPRELDVHAILTPWIASEATWHEASKGRKWKGRNLYGRGDTRKEAEASCIASRSETGSGWHTWDISALVRQWCKGELDNHGVAVSWAGKGRDPVVYSSSEVKGEHAPKLEVDYESPASLAALENKEFFAASNNLLDKRGRELIEQVVKSGYAVEDVAALKAVVNIKRFTLAHCDLAIQHHFSADVVLGLRRALEYTGHTAESDQAQQQYRVIDTRNAQIQAALAELGVEYETVFPLVVTPPLNLLHDIRYKREHFEKRYQGSRDFVKVTTDMLARAQALLASSKSAESEARKLLATLGAGGGADWAPDSPLRTEVGINRTEPVRNFDDSGKPTSIIIGASLGRTSGSHVDKVNLDLQSKFRFDVNAQRYSGNHVDEKGALCNTGARYNRDSIPGDIIQACGNHSRGIYLPMPLFLRFQKATGRTQIPSG